MVTQAETSHSMFWTQNLFHLFPQKPLGAPQAVHPDGVSPTEQEEVKCVPTKGVATRLPASIGIRAVDNVCDLHLWEQENAGNTPCPANQAREYVEDWDR